MQLFRCPFCGLRDETEFHYAGEAGNARPEPSEAVPAESWAAYLFLRDNPKGATREVWTHLPCGELFVMARNTVTHECGASEALHGGDDP